MAYKLSNPFHFREVPVRIVTGRIPTEERDPAKHYYGLRHTDSDWDFPITVEPNVTVNYWATLVTDSPLDMSKGGLNLTEDESYLFIRMESGDVEEES